MVLCISFVAAQRRVASGRLVNRKVDSVRSPAEGPDLFPSFFPIMFMSREHEANNFASCFA